MYDMTSIGEIVIDFTQIESPDNKICMMASAGGAPGNVLVQASKLGARTSYIGAIGRDMFGEFLKKEMNKYKIDMSGMIETDKATTTLAIVYFDSEGDRRFDFVRAPGADTMIVLNDKGREVLDNTRILLYGSLGFAQDPTRTTILDAIEEYKDRCVIAYDPNLRPAIWNDDARMRKYAKLGLKNVKILKLGDDEATFLMERDNVDDAVKAIQDEFGIPMIFVTRGKNGCKYFMDGRSDERPSYPIKTLDTTGAGDSFFGALLWQLLKFDCHPAFDDLGPIVEFANAAGAVAAMRKGTMDVLGYENEILDCMKKYGK